MTVIDVNETVDSMREAMPKGGLLMVRTRMADQKEASAATHQHVEPGEYLKLSVSDTGVGMDADTASHIFEPFFTTKEMGEGTTFDLFFPTVVATETEPADDSSRVPAPVAEQRERRGSGARRRLRRIDRSRAERRRDAHDGWTGDGREAPHDAARHPRLYMSGYIGEAIAGRGGLSPHDTIIRKPFTATGLLKSVREALV